MSGPVRPILPLPGPLAEDPTPMVADMTTARTMLASAVVDVERGAYDERIITWLSGWDISIVATMASLLRRCFEAGVATGRAEIVDEQPTVQALRAQAEALGRALAVDRAAADRYGNALDDIVAAIAVYDEETAGTQDGRTATLLAAIEDAIGDLR